jgi:hypothetical protein
MRDRGDRYCYPSACLARLGVGKEGQHAVEYVEEDAGQQRLEVIGRSHRAAAAARPPLLAVVPPPLLLLPSVGQD